MFKISLELLTFFWEDLQMFSVIFDGILRISFCFLKSLVRCEFVLEILGVILRF